MTRISKVLALTGAFLALWASSPAAAQDGQVRIESTAGYSEVRITIEGGATGHQVALPAGTIVSTGNAQQQDLMLGEAVSLEVGAGMRQTLVVHTFCLHSDRSPPAPGQAMHVLSSGTQELRRLVSIRGAVADEVLQSAVWAHRNGEVPTDEMVLKAFLLAGVAPKD